MSGVLEATSYSDGSKGTVANIDQIQPQPVAINYSRRKGRKSYFIAPQNNEEKNELADALLAGDGGGELGSERSMKRLDVPGSEKDDEQPIKDKLHKNGHAQKKDGGSGGLLKKKDPFLFAERDDAAFPLPSKRERAEEAAAIVKKDKEEQQPKLDKDENIIAMALLKKDKSDVTATKKSIHAVPKKEKEPAPSPLVVDDDGITDDEFARITGGGKAKDDVSFKSSEPTTVRSILARAKEVLQTLDGSKPGKTDSYVEKRENIALLKNATEPSVEENYDAGSAAESTPVAPVSPVLSDQAVTKAQSTKSIIAAGKPKPGVKKSGSPPQVGAFGNTP